MNFTIKHILLVAVLIGIMAALISAARQSEPDQTYQSIAFSPDGKHLAVLGTRSTQIFDVSTGRKIARLNLFSTGFPDHVEFVDNETLFLVSWGTDGSVRHAARWFRWRSGNLLRKLDVDPTYQHFATARGGFVFSDNSTSRTDFYLKDVDQAQSLTSLLGYLDPSLFHVGLGRHFNGTPNDLDLSLPAWTISTKVEDFENEKKLTPLIELAAQTKISPDGKFFVMEMTHSYSYHQESDGKTIWKEDIGYPTNSAFSPDGKFVSIEDRWGERKIVVFECESGKRIKEFDLDHQFGAPITFSDQGMVAVCTHQTSSTGIEIWDLNSSTRIRTVGATNSEQESLRFSAFYTLWLLIWSIACVFVLKRPVSKLKLPRIVSVVFWILLLALGIFLAFTTFGQVYSYFQGVPREGLIQMLAVPMLLMIVALICMVLAFQRLLKRVIVTPQNSADKVINAESGP